MIYPADSSLRLHSSGGFPDLKMVELVDLGCLEDLVQRGGDRSFRPALFYPRKKTALVGPKSQGRTSLEQQDTRRGRIAPSKRVPRFFPGSGLTTRVRGEVLV